MANQSSEAWRVKGRTGGVDAEAINKRLHQVEESVRRMQRFDPESATMREHQQLEQLLTELGIMAHQVQGVLRQRGVADYPHDDTQALLRVHEEARRFTRAKEVAAHTAYAQRLAEAQQVLTDCCVCGEHRGITFIEGEEILAADVCPVQWWVTQSRLAHNAGNLSTFLTSYPFADYVSSYRI